MSAQQKPPDVQYRTYITDGGSRFYLRDIIAHEHKEHYYFDTDSRYAMRFRKWDMAMKYRDRMVRAKYHPHIESF